MIKRVPNGSNGPIRSRQLECLLSDAWGRARNHAIVRSASAIRRAQGAWRAALVAMRMEVRVTETSWRDNDAVGGGLGRPLKLPAHAMYVHWSFGAQSLSSVSFDITMHADPGCFVGEYLSPYNGTIDGHQFYFGIWTTVRERA